MAYMSDGARESEAWTILRLLSWIQEHFAQQGVRDERLCAELLIAHALGGRRIDLYTRFDQIPTEEQRATLRDLVRRAGQHVPIAYLTGRKEFFSLELRVSPAVLIPRPETETLVEQIVHQHRRGGENGATSICDVGTGSGCIAIALARNLPDATVTAGDVSAEALAVAKANVEDCGVADRIQLVHSDLLESLPGPFDVIVSNPPYIADTVYGELPRTVRDYEPALALRGGPDGLDVIRRLIDQAAAALSPRGHLLLETGYDQARHVVALLQLPGCWQDISTIRDSLGHERVVCARLKS